MTILENKKLLSELITLMCDADIRTNNNFLSSISHKIYVEDLGTLYHEVIENSVLKAQ